MRGAWWALVGMVVVGCGSATVSRPLRWVPTGRAAGIDAEQRALLARMNTAEPTEDAITARESIWRVDASLGDDDVRALLVSSVAWIEVLEREGDLERLRSGACRPSHTGSKQDTDVISELASEGRRAPTRAREEPAGWSHAGLGLAWFEPHLADARCDRAYRALRALAVTRAWLGANVDDAGVLETFQDAVERVRPPVTSTCDETEDDAIARAIVRHLFELDPFPFDGEGTRACLRVNTLGGPFSYGAPDSAWAFSVGTPYPYDASAWGLAEGRIRDGEDAHLVEVVMMGWHGGPLSVFVVARRGGAWRVLDGAQVGQACR